MTNPALACSEDQAGGGRDVWPDDAVHTGEEREARFAADDRQSLSEDQREDERGQLGARPESQVRPDGFIGAFIFINYF